MTSAYLVIVAGDEGAYYAISPRRETVIGRGGHCDILIRKRSVSREHARLSHIGDQFFIEDLGSVNGTFVNGAQITSATRLHNGDRINIYGVVFQFELGEVPLSKGPSPREHMPVAIPIAAPGNERFALALEIIRQLGSSLDVDAILPKVLDKLFAMFPYAMNGEILLLNARDELIPRAMKHGRDADGSLLTLKPVGGTLAREVLETGKPFLATDSAQDRDSVFHDSLHSKLCVPMISPANHPVGVIHLESDDAERQFSEGDMELVAFVATVAAHALEYAREHAERLAIDLRREQLQAAKDVQARMLPQGRPEVPGYRFLDYYRAADKIGGDYYGYFRLPDGRVAVAVADVCGKGLPAALTMAELASEVRRCLETSPTVKQAMSHLNQHFSRRETFITFILSILDPQNHTLTITSAGHPSPLRRSGASGKVEPMLLEKAGLPLGIRSKEVYHPMVFPVEPGDLFLLYTDGISEAYGPGRELFGIRRLVESIRQPSLAADELIASLLSDLAAFCAGSSQTDDICLVCLSRELTTIEPSDRRSQLSPARSATGKSKV